MTRAMKDLIIHLCAVVVIVCIVFLARSYNKEEPVDVNAEKYASYNEGCLNAHWFIFTQTHNTTVIPQQFASIAVKACQDLTQRKFLE